MLVVLVGYTGSENIVHTYLVVILCAYQIERSYIVCKCDLLNILLKCLFFIRYKKYFVRDSQVTPQLC